jgi:hypothetical protein
MTLRLIDEVYLYTSSQPEDALTNRELVSWFDHSGIPYIHLSYGNDNHEEVLTAVNTWWRHDIDTGILQEPLTGFPFVVYTESHSDKPISYLPRKYITTKENIVEQLPSLYSLGRD